MDVLFYSFALTTVRSEFHLTSAQAGALAAVPMVTSAAGGVLFGYLSDRFGRARMLGWSIFTFSLLTALTATSRTVPQLVFWRAAAGIGLGGEWAVGSVLIAETWPERHRGKGIGLMQSGWALGYMAAAILAAMILRAGGGALSFSLAPRQPSSPGGSAAASPSLSPGVNPRRPASPRANSCSRRCGAASRSSPRCAAVCCSDIGGCSPGFRHTSRARWHLAAPV